MRKKCTIYGEWHLPRSEIMNNEIEMYLNCSVTMPHYLLSCLGTSKKNDEIAFMLRQAPVWRSEHESLRIPFTVDFHETCAVSIKIDTTNPECYLIGLREQHLRHCIGTPMYFHSAEVPKTNTSREGRFQESIV